MDWMLIIVAAWLVVSVPFALLVANTIRRAHDTDEDGSDGSRDGP